MPLAYYQALEETVLWDMIRNRAIRCPSEQAWAFDALRAKIAARRPLSESWGN